jgi:hypothetical protein
MWHRVKYVVNQKRVRIRMKDNVRHNEACTVFNIVKSSLWVVTENKDTELTLWGMAIICEIYGPHSRVDEDSSFLRYDAMSIHIVTDVSEKLAVSIVRVKTLITIYQSPWRHIHKTWMFMQILFLSFKEHRLCLL